MTDNNSSIGEDELMKIVKKLGKKGLPDSLPMLSAESKTGLANASRLDVKQQHDQLDNSDQIGVRARLTSEPSGHVVVLFDEQYKNTITKMMLSGMDDVPQGMANDASKELCNLFVSGYVDKIAKVFGTNIDYQAPTLVNEGKKDIIKKTSRMGSNRYAFVLKAGIKANGNTIPVYIYHFPEIREFLKLAEERFGGDT